MTPHIESLIAKMASGLEGDEDEALVAVSAMVGGLLLSRVVADPKRSDAILRAVKNSLTARKEPPASTPDGVCGVTTKGPAMRTAPEADPDAGSAQAVRVPFTAWRSTPRST